MGGHAVGEKAAAKAASDIPHLISKSTNDAASALRKAYAEANAGIHSIGQENPEFRGLGTTATALWLRPEGAYVGHVGDSRAYRLRDGHLEQLTFDHSAVWEIARRQGIRPDQLHGVKTNVILRSLGPEATVEVDVEGPHPLKPGDTFLLCSDGLSGQLSDYEIGAILATLPATEACEFLIELANLRGGPDNCTVIIVRLSGEPEVPAAPPPPVRFAAAQAMAALGDGRRGYSRLRRSITRHDATTGKRDRGVCGRHCRASCRRGRPDLETASPGPNRRQRGRAAAAACVLANIVSGGGSTDRQTCSRRIRSATNYQTRSARPRWMK